MNNELTQLDEILYKGLRPWLDTNKPDEKFTPVISKIKTVYPGFQMLYEIDFIRPFNSKTEYYQKLILNESVAYCNNVVELINEDDNTKLKKYWLNDTLNNKLQTRLKDIGSIIKEKQYDISYINPRKNSFVQDADHKTATYVMQLLKTAFIRIYLEIQEVFKELFSHQLLIEDDFYTRFLNEPVPDNSFLKEVPQTIIIDNKLIKAQGTQKPEFTPILDDNRPLIKGVGSYHDLVKNPQRFGMFEENLFLNDYIDTNYAYCGKHGYKNQLAIIYHVVIEKQYFKTFNDSTKRKISPTDIVKFLNHRYGVDIDKQFRSYKDKIEERTQFLESTSWLYRLPAL